MTASYDIPVVIDRREGPYGEVVLRRHGALLQIIANGCFLMDTSDGRSERLLVDAALDALDGRTEPEVLIGGSVSGSLWHTPPPTRAGGTSPSSNAKGPSSTGTVTDRWRNSPRRRSPTPGPKS